MSFRDRLWNFHYWHPAVFLFCTAACTTIFLLGLFNVLSGSIPEAKLGVYISAFCIPGFVIGTYPAMVLIVAPWRKIISRNTD